MENKYTEADLKKAFMAGRASYSSEQNQYRAWFKWFTNFLTYL